MSVLSRHASREVAVDFIAYAGTVLALDAANRRAEALAVRDGKVIALGTSREMLALAGERTQLFDLKGRTAIPGFIETHNHPMLLGSKLRFSVDAGTPPNDGIADILERIAAKVAVTPPGEWIRAERYDDTLLKERRHPTRWDLDRVTLDHPVYMTHVSGHFSVANSCALAIGGITAATADPPGGLIFRDERGEPTGVLAEQAAQQIVSRHLPSPSMEDLIEALSAANDEYLAAGVTSVHDLAIGWFGGLAEVNAYRRAMESGRFRPRCYGFLAEQMLPELGGDRLSPWQVGVAGLGDDRFRLGAVKMWADGSIQGLTGALSEPYQCAPDTCGLPIYSGRALEQRVRMLSEAGWHVGIHGNGDAGIQAIIDGYAASGAGEPGYDHRFRIEHCQMACEDQLERIAALGIHTSFFVKHVYYWGDRHRDIFIGPRRAQRISPLQSAKRCGIRFALHSDCPVTPIPPLEGIWSAVNRITRNGDVLGAEQQIDVETALRCYTSEAAYLSFEEDRKGTLEPGKFGDVTVLSEDPTAIEPRRLRDVAVEATIIGGNVVWAKGKERP